MLKPFPAKLRTKARDERSLRGAGSRHLPETRVRLSNIGRLAVSAMTDLASRSNGGPVAMADVARRQGISRTYMEKMLCKLRRHKLVKASRGPGGGYSLGRSAEAISVGDIVCAIDGDEGEAARLAKPGANRCSTDELWVALAEKMIGYLDSVSLASLAEAHLARGGGGVEPTLRLRALAAGATSEMKSAPPNSVFAPR